MKSDHEIQKMGDIKKMYKRVYHILKENGMAKTAVIVEGPGKGSRCVIEQGKLLACDETDWSELEAQILAKEETGLFQAGEQKVFVELYHQNPQLIILGGGHVSCPVAHLGNMLGFHVTVMDDRPEFLTRERFPDADQLILGSFEELSEKIPLYENAYYVVVTRGHTGDSICARQILRRPYVYFGMIGSKTKVRLSREKLMEEGFTEKELDTIHAPIGLPIGGQLPEEIAISIMAEIVQEKNRRYLSFVDEKVEEAVLKGKKGVMLTIVKKAGSSPRGIGSKMFLGDDGSSYGSIGGGSVEYEAMQHAARVTGTELVSYNLSVSDQRNLGMICGGSVDVLFEKI